MKRLARILAARHRLIAIAILALMLVLGAASMRGDAGIVDEVAHIPAGYSSLKYQDYRLNPEHPPLIKDLAALPLMFMDLKFPDNQTAWTTAVNGQWETGWNFIYHGGNDADAILFWSRLPVLLLAIGVGWILYRFVLKRFGHYVALLALFLYALSPEIIAHARFVTTDVGAMAFMLLFFFAFVNYVERPNPRTLALATIAMAGAQLAKFSAILLIPFMAVITLIMIFVGHGRLRQRLRNYGLGFVLIMSGAMVIVLLFYMFHTANMPLAVQDRLIEESLHGGWVEAVSQVLIRVNHLPGLKALSQYILGILMVFNRVGGGNTTYFLGEVTNQSFLYYFPVTFLIKLPLASLVLMAGALIYAIKEYLVRTPLRLWQKLKDFAGSSPLELTAVGFIIFYAYTSITGNLNLGIRHLLPIMPLIFILTAKNIVELVKKYRWLVPLLAGILIFYLYANLKIFPNYAAYFNELIGGPDNAYKYTSDSSVDWGQDLKRLRTYVDKQGIKDIAVDYFGGGEPKYYFCTRLALEPGEFGTDKAYDCAGSVYKEWHAQNGLYPGQYMAVSETFLMNDIYWSRLRGDNGYAQLRQMEPVAKVGYSIYVYKLR